MPESLPLIQNSRRFAFIRGSICAFRITGFHSRIQAKRIPAAIGWRRGTETVTCGEVPEAGRVYQLKPARMSLEAAVVMSPLTRKVR
jgi:hypothetical protein